MNAKAIPAETAADKLETENDQVADVFRFSPALNWDQRVQVWIEVPITFQVL